MKKYAVFSDYSPDADPELYDTCDEAMKDIKERLHDPCVNGVNSYLCQVLYSAPTVKNGDTFAKLYDADGKVIYEEKALTKDEYWNEEYDKFWKNWRDKNE